MFKPAFPAALCVLLLAATLGGCKSLPMWGEELRHLPTGVEPGERIGFAVRSFVTTYKPGGGAPETTAPASEYVRMKLEECLANEVQRADDATVPLVVEPYEFSAAVRHTALSARPGLRYAVAVDAIETHGETKFLVVPLLIVMAYAHGRKEALEYRASIYDLQRGVLAGTVTATSGGAAGTKFAAFVSTGDFERTYIDRDGLCKDLATRVRLFLARQP